MATSPDPRKGHAKKSNYAQVALVLQGGGALGAYQAGTYQALAEAGFEPDWLSGISIGAINAAIIAGNAPEHRVERLRRFWTRVTRPYPVPFFQFGDAVQGMLSRMSALVSLAAGQPGFYAPVMPPAIMRPQGAPGAVSVYDTNALRKTLEELVDFDRINSGRTRLSLGAVNIRLGNFIYFDNTERTISVDHVMASGALPPGFPPVQVDGELYWDGGLVSNTPLAPVLEYGPKKDTLVFQVDLFSARGDVPRDVWEGEARRKQIVFSSRTRLNTDYFREKHELRMAIVQLFEKLPPEARQKAEMQKLRDLGEDHAISIVHLIYRPQRYEGLSADYEFSRATMEQHWQAGIENVKRTLRHQEWNEPPSAVDGLKVFDIAEAEMDQMRRSYASKRRMSGR